MTASMVNGEFIATMEDPDSPEMFERNRIHTDAGAQEYGFKGAFVGGATLYGWCVPTILEALGEQWLSTGWTDVKFIKPTYPGSRIRVEISQNDDLTYKMQALQDDGEPAIVGNLGLGNAPWLGDLRETPFGACTPDVGERPRLTLEDAPIGQLLRSYTYGRSIPDPSSEESTSFVELATSDGTSVVHPMTISLQMIRLLAHSFEYGRPSIHISSQIQNFARVPADENVVLYGTFVDAYERRGNHCSVIDADLYTESGTHLIRQRHTNVFKVRRATE